MPTRSSRAAEPPRRVLAGTSGWSYEEWKGPFYPEALASREMLRFYAERLPAVEVNNTFYRLPKASVLAGWASQVPEGFRFALKASRRITHLKRLRDVAEETAYFLSTAGALGPRLGALLFQLPPNLKLDLDRLDAFLALLPEGAPAAFEFRHPSWADPAVHERLRARAFAWVIADVEEAPPPPFVTTAPWTYLRLRRPGYTAPELTAWLAHIRSGEVFASEARSEPQVSGAVGAGFAGAVHGRLARQAYVFFKHEDAGAGPRLAAELLALAHPAPLRAGAASARDLAAGSSE